MEQHLFGVEASESSPLRIGALEEAHGGTLYLDEVGDMPRETQSKILRVLVDQNFQRVGGGTRVAVDVRLISSTSRDLVADIAQGRFREDLFHRLNVVPVRVPSLAERREDVPELIGFFMEQISLSSGIPRRRNRRRRHGRASGARLAGNIRQLRNNVERLMILTSGDNDQEISAEMLPQELGSMAPPTPGGSGGEKLLALPLREAREVFEREYLGGPDRPLRRQHLADRRIHRYGKVLLCTASSRPGALAENDVCAQPNAGCYRKTLRPRTLVFN